MSTSDESERRLAEALRARATGAGRPGPNRHTPPMPGLPVRAAAPKAAPTVTTILLIALLVGAVLGAGFGLLSLLAPGLLPALG